jgi:hypothetical protein
VLFDPDDPLVTVIGKQLASAAADRARERCSLIVRQRAAAGS